MDAAAFHHNDEGRVADESRSLATEELDRRIRTGWEEWCDLLQGLIGTGGMLPSRELAGRVVVFFEDIYWRAEEARVEALRRQFGPEGQQRCRRGRDRVWGIG